MEGLLRSAIHYMSIDEKLTKNGCYPHLTNSNIKNSDVPEDYGSPIY